MNRSIYILFSFILFVSCDYFAFEKKTNQEEIVASVANEFLYKKDIVNLFPKIISKQDSIVLAKSIINSWATKQLLLEKASENVSESNTAEINQLVRDYKQGLLINGYKEKLVKQQLDTVISEEEIENYYQENNTNFKLNEELLKLKYLQFSKDLLDKKDIIKLFKSDNIVDMEILEEKRLSFKAIQLNDSVWRSLDNVMLKTPFSRENLLKKTKFFQLEDSLDLYLVAIKDVLRRNNIAPLSYVKPTIKQMILHKRKLELIREIEKILIQDAVKNKSFKIY